MTFFRTHNMNEMNDKTAALAHPKFGLASSNSSAKEDVLLRNALLQERFYAILESSGTDGIPFVRAQIKHLFDAGEIDEKRVAKLERMMKSIEKGFAQAAQEKVWKIPTSHSEQPEKTEVVFLEDKAFSALPEHFTRALLPKDLVKIEAKMTADARNAVLKTNDFLSAAQIAEIAGFTSKELNKLKDDGAIFFVNQNNIDLFPGYALDSTNKYQPFASVSEAIKILANFKNNWELALWFASVNSFLGGDRPQDLIAQAPEKVIAAAKDAVAKPHF